MLYCSFVRYDDKKIILSVNKNYCRFFRMVRINDLFIYITQIIFYLNIKKVIKKNTFSQRHFRRKIIIVLSGK